MKPIEALRVSYPELVDVIEGAREDFTTAEAWGEWATLVIRDWECELTHSVAEALG
jgi:hypothetical protein